MKHSIVLAKILFLISILLTHESVAMAVSEPKYSVESKTDHYEIRSYASTLAAQTLVNESFEDAGNKAFRILANYIFGNNRSKTKIAMTAPVSQVKNANGYLVQFTMPEEYTMATLPEPNDPRVQIVQIPARKVAVFSYSGSWSEDRYKSKLEEFKQALSRDQVVIVGEAVFARFNSPFQMILNRDSNPGISGTSVSNFMLGLLRGVNRIQHLFRDNDLKGSVKNISAHYDLGNEFFRTFLDESMTYSSGYFGSGAQTLEQAQLAKLMRLADSVQVKPGDHVLEIGSSWGAFAIFLAKERGCRVTTVTVSRRQYEAVKTKIREAGLENQIEARFQDYRKIEGRFDKIVSVEMIEAVGHKHLPEYFATAERCLKENGLFGIQVITSADSRYEIIRKSVDWTQKHIFPGSLIPSLSALTEASRKSSRFQMHSLHDLGKCYARTLAEWRSRFNDNLTQIRELGFDEPFIRAWNYYFSYCEAAFDTRHISVKQIVFTRPNNSELT